MTAWNHCRNRCGERARYRTGNTCKGCQKRAWYAKNREHALDYAAAYQGRTRRPNTNITGAPRMIRSLNDLIERLEALKADIPVTGLTLSEHEQVAWARRPLQALVERCQERLEDLSWQAHGQGERAVFVDALEAAQ